MENFRDKENILDTDKDESIDHKHHKHKTKKRTKSHNAKAVLYDSEGNIIHDGENEENKNSNRHNEEAVLYDSDNSSDCIEVINN